MADIGKVIKGLQNLRDAIATDFIHEADQAVGTIDDAIALLKEYKREDGCPCTHCMEWECNEVCEEYKTWKDT
jgi:hypothetical protein